MVIEEHHSESPALAPPVRHADDATLEAVGEAPDDDFATAVLDALPDATAVLDIRARRPR